MKSGILLVMSTCLAVFVLTAQPGCGSGSKLTDVYSTNIKKLHGCYDLYMDEHNYIGPKNEEEFKTYLKTDKTAVYLLKRIDVTPDDIDGLFISDRDGEPFVVRYGLRGEANHAYIFEKTGVDGERLIALSNVQAYGSPEYDDWLSGKTKPETPADAERAFEEDEAADTVVVPTEGNTEPAQ